MMTAYLRKIILPIFCITLAACGAQPLTAPPAQPVASDTPSYTIGNDDQLDIRVWQEPELSVKAVVRPDGFITLPLIGDVAAAGKTAEELRDDLTQKLSTYLKSPQVSVIIASPQSAQFQQRVRVTGAVNQPLSTAWRDGMTVLDIILMSGGANDFASPNKARLFRKDGDAIKAYPIYLDDILNKGKLDTNYQLQPSDIISVPERKF